MTRLGTLAEDDLKNFAEITSQSLDVCLGKPKNTSNFFLGTTCKFEIRLCVLVKLLPIAINICFCELVYLSHAGLEDGSEETCVSVHISA